MTLRQRVIPSVPKGVAITALAPNLKLFSDAEIKEIKSRFTLNGRYRTYVDAAGCEQKLKYPIFVFDGEYYAAYPGKLALLGKATFGKVKVVQDLDSGKWLPEKVITVKEQGYNRMSCEEIDHEADMLVAVQRAALTRDQQPVRFFKPAHPKQKSLVENQEPVYFGGGSLMFKEGLEVTQREEDAGKYYLFMKRAHGMNLREWLNRKMPLPAIIKMDISIGLIGAVMDVHAHHVLHRDLKPENLMFDMFQAIHQRVSVVDFGLSIKMNEVHDGLVAGQGTEGYKAPEIRRGTEKNTGKYSVKSDVYALGVTLSVLWSATHGLTLKEPLARLIDSMMQSDADKRPSLLEVSEALHQMKEKLNDNERLVTICMLEVDAFIEMSQYGEEYLQQFMNDLGVYDQICLYDRTDASTDQELLAIKHKLEANQLVVANRVYVGPYVAMQAYVAERHQMRAEDGAIHCLKLITDKSVYADESISSDAGEPHDVILDVNHLTPASRHQDLLPEEMSYDLGGCIAWFFTSLADDVRHLADHIVDSDSEDDPHHHRHIV